MKYHNFSKIAESQDFECKTLFSNFNIFHIVFFKFIMTSMIKILIHKKKIDSFVNFYKKINDFSYVVKYRV